MRLGRSRSFPTCGTRKFEKSPMPKIDQAAQHSWMRALRKRLLDWFEREKRVLPWRTEPSPYRVWIAEIMLQQTRVETVLRYYERFLARFPDVASLAAAAEKDVLELWAGLGYYRRARNLWAAARKIATEAAGVFPAEFEQVLQLPGIGKYTAGAIHSIAFNQPRPVVDGNVRRVIGRVRGILNAPESYYWSEAESWLAHKAPGQFNQALMELGALVCTPARPGCGACPLLPLCASGAAGRMPELRSGHKRGAQTVELVIVIVECGERVLLERQSRAGFIPGDMAFPVRALEAGTEPKTAAAALALAILGKPQKLAARPTVRHAITHRRIRAHVFRAEVKAAGRLAPRYEWHPKAGAAKSLTSSLFHKALRT